MNDLYKRVVEGYNNTMYPLFDASFYATPKYMQDYVMKHLVNDPKLALVYYHEDGNPNKLKYHKNVRYCKFVTLIIME